MNDAKTVRHAPPPVPVVRRSPEEVVALLTRTGADATIMWDGSNRTHRIVPGPKLTTEKLDEVRRELEGAYAVLDHTSPAGRDQLGAIMDGLTSSMPGAQTQDDDRPDAAMPRRSIPGIVP